MMKKFHSGKSLLILCSLAGALTLQAQTERDLRFSEKLNEIQLYDYSELFLRGLLAKNPADPGRIQVQLIDALLHQNKVDAAMDFYRKIPRNTENFQRANGVIGVYYFRRDPKRALSHLMPMLDYCIRTKQDPKSWEQPATALFNLLKEQGMAKDSERLVTWLQSAQNQDDRTKMYSQCILRMDTIENAIKAEPETISRYDEAVSNIRKNGKDEVKEHLEGLIKAKDDVDDEPGAERNAAYQKLGAFLKIDLTPMRNYNLYNSKRQEEKNVFLNRATISQSEIAKVRRGDRNDWMINLVNTMFDLEGIQWGGQDIASASAAALSIRGFYLMGEYEAGILHAKKFEELFDGCDQMLTEDGHPELSPGADARIWEGYCNLELARKYMKKKDQKNAKKHYIRAFKNFGTVLKNCPKHKNGPAVYVTFGQVIDELSTLSPNLASKLEEERGKVPRPQAEDPGSQKLVSSMAEENFRQKNFKEVVDELMPVMQAPGNRRNPGFAELLNKLAISQVLTDDYLTPLAISDYMASQLPKNGYSTHTLKTCANLIWQKAADLEKDPKTKAEALRLKDVAIDFYRRFIRIGIDDTEAAPIAMRLANEFYNRANALGKTLNAEKDQDKRAEIRKEWLKAFDYAVEHYQFIIDHFGNREGDLNVAYLRAAECYVITERYEQAAAAYAKYCESDPEDKILLLQSKENVAETLYRSGADHEKKSRSYLEAAAAVVIPEVPEKPVEPAKPVPAAAAAPAAAGQPAASSEDTYKKALAAYERELAEYENLAKEADVMKQKKEKLESQAQEEKTTANSFFKQAIAQLDELNKWLTPGSKVMAAIQKMKSAEKDAKKRIAMDEKVAGVRKLSTRLLPWLYDGIGEKKKAIDAFMKFITMNKDRKDPKDNIPGYMMRVGMLYTEIGEDAKAQAVLSDLSAKYPDSPEGKNAKFALARNLYGNGTYAKALAIFKEIFDGKDVNNLSISNLRWIASELSQCPSTQFAKECAEFAYRASIRLLESLKKPDYKEWVGDLKAIEFQNNKESKALFDSQITQKINLDAGKSALILERYPEAVKFFTKVYETEKSTAYFNQLFFARAEAYCKLKDYAAARKDLSRISSRAMTRTQGQKQPKYWLYNKAQTLIGETFMDENEPAKAFTVYSMVALPAVSKNAVKVEPSGDPEDDSAKYVELAVYKAALTAARIGRKADRDLFVEGYKELYPKGFYITEIDNLPEADSK